MSKLVVVEYTDTNGHARWGYLSRSAFQVMRSLEGKEGADTARIPVYLSDGTTGDAAVSDLRMVESFATMTPQMEQSEPEEELLLEDRPHSIKLSDELEVVIEEAEDGETT